MCFNSTSSIIAFSFGTFISILLLLKKEYFYSLFSFSIVIIQLIEYFAHKSIDNNNKSLNILSSKLIYIIIFLQPIIFTLGLIYFPPSNIEFKFKNRLSNFIILGIIYLIMFLLLWFYNEKNNGFKITYINKCDNICRLNWSMLLTNMLYSLPFVILYFCLFINFNFITKNNNLYILNNFTTLILFASILYTIFVDKAKTFNTIYSVFPSLWCFLAVFYGLIILIFKK